MTNLIRTTDAYLAQLTHHEVSFVKDVFEDFRRSDFSDVAWWLDNEQNNIENGAEEAYNGVDVLLVTGEELVAAVIARIGSMTAAQCIKQYAAYFTPEWDRQAA
jgi:hypothetical protein